MDALISLAIVVILFAVAAYGLWWVCTQFGLPVVVKWICGGILLILILMYMAGQVHVGAFHLIH